MTSYRLTPQAGWRRWERWAALQAEVDLHLGQRWPKRSLAERRRAASLPKRRDYEPARAKSGAVKLLLGTARPVNFPLTSGFYV